MRGERCCRMSEYDQYSKCLVRSVNHIFKNFLGDESITEVYETQARDKDPQVAVMIKGSLRGEIIINLPRKTLDQITSRFIKSNDTRLIKRSHQDVAGELANLITATFANQLQYADYDIQLTPPEFNDDPIAMKALYENVNLSFKSSYGGFDIDLFYRNEE